MSNDKDFDRLFQKAFEKWSFEPSEEGVHKMASQLNAMENTRLDALFTSKLSAWKQAVSAGALKRMKWLLFWRKNRAVLSGSAVLLLLAAGGWWYVGEQNTSTRVTQPQENIQREIIDVEPTISGNPQDQALPMETETHSDAHEGRNTPQATANAEPQHTATRNSEPSQAEPRNTGRTDGAAQTSASTQERGGQKDHAARFGSREENILRTENAQTIASTGMNAETPITGSDASESNSGTANPAATDLAPAGSDEPTALAASDESPEQGEEEELDASSVEGDEAEETEETALVSNIPAAPWRSFKPLNWYYSISAGVDVGVSQSALTPTPHVGFRVTRLLNPLITLQTGVNYLQRGHINESLYHSDTVYNFGMELHQREARPIRMHFVEVPIVLGWQFAPGQYIHVGGSASYAFMHEVQETVVRWVAENATVASPETPATHGMRGTLHGLAQWDVNVKWAYGIKFNPRWGAQIGGTIGLRDITDGAVFNASANERNRSMWLQGSLQYQLNRIK